MQDRRKRGCQWCPPLPPFHVWYPGCCIHPILYLKDVTSLVVLAPTAEKSWRRAWFDVSKYKDHSVYMQCNQNYCLTSAVCGYNALISFALISFV